MREINNSYTCQHHVDFLTKCRKEKLTPKGLRLHLTVNVLGKEHEELDQEIDKILKHAESQILQTLTDYYSHLTDDFHRGANALKQQMEDMSTSLPEAERAKHNREVNYTETKATIKARDRETTRLRKIHALKHEQSVNPHQKRTEAPPRRTPHHRDSDTSTHSVGSTYSGGTTDVEAPTLNLRSRSILKNGKGPRNKPRTRSTSARRDFHRPLMPPRTEEPTPQQAENPQDTLTGEQLHFLNALKPFLKDQYTAVIDVLGKN